MTPTNDQAPAEPKFKRSSNRCHLITRTPVYDAAGNTRLYNLHFTAGTLFKPDVLEFKHVPHVMMGFFVRRSMNIFVGRRGNAMVTMPVCNEMTRFVTLLPLTRFVLRIPERQECTPTYEHLIHGFHRQRMQLAIGIYTAVYTNWAKSIRCFDYIVMDMSKDVEEQTMMAANIRRVCPDVKLLCDYAYTVNEADISFEVGASLVSCPAYSQNILQTRFNAAFAEGKQEFFSELCRLLADLMSPQPQFAMFDELCRRYPLVNQRIPPLLDLLQFKKKDGREITVDDLIDMPRYNHGALDDELMDLDNETVSKFEAITCMLLCSLFFESDFNRKEGIIFFEPFKTALIRARFVELLVKSSAKAGPAPKPAFAAAICSTMKLFVIDNKTDIPAYKDLNDVLDQTLAQFPSIDQAIRCVYAIEQLDIDTINELTDPAGYFELKKATSYYEDAVVWSVAVEKVLSGGD